MSYSPEDMRERIEDNDYIYQHLMFLHRNEHLGDNCFCTTEVAGAYRNILEEINRLLQETDQKARADIDTKSIVKLLENYTPNAQVERQVLEARIMELRKFMRHEINVFGNCRTKDSIKFDIERLQFKLTQLKEGEQ